MNSAAAKPDPNSPPHRAGQFPAIDIRDLSLTFQTDDGTVDALSHVSLSVGMG